MRETIVVLEPGIQAYKEPVLRQIRAETEERGMKLCVLYGIPFEWAISWARPFSDYQLQVDYHDVKVSMDLLMSLAKTNKLNIRGVITYVDTSVPFANALQHKLNLPVICENETFDFRDKFFVRKNLEKLEFANPSYSAIESRAHIVESAERWKKYPAVVKPSGMMSSLAVRKVYNKEELILAAERAFLADFPEENLRSVYPSLSSRVLIEEMIKGQEYSMEGYVHEGAYTFLGLTKKETTPDQFCDEVSHIFPSETEISAPALSKAIREVSNWHAALRYKNTFTHTELKFTKAGPRLIELNPRLAGGLISVLMSKSKQIDAGKALVSLALGEKPNNFNGSRHPHPFQLNFLDTTEEGRLIRLDSKKSLKKDTETVILLQPGSVIYKNKNNSRTRLAAVITAFGQQHKEWPYFETAIQAPVVNASPLSSQDLLIFDAIQTDLDLLLRIERDSWPTHLAAKKSTIKKRIDSPSCKTLLAWSPTTSKGTSDYVGFISAALIPNFSLESHHSWKQYARSALNTNRPTKPNALYIITISVTPQAPSGTAASLIQAVNTIRKIQKIPFLAYGTRLSGLKDSKLSPQAYYEGLISGSIREPSFGASRLAGGRPIALLSNYYDDPDSLNFGALIIHEDSWQ